MSISRKALFGFDKMCERWQRKIEDFSLEEEQAF
jgi:hypothetical protein